MAEEYLGAVTMAPGNGLLLIGDSANFGRAYRHASDGTGSRGFCLDIDGADAELLATRLFSGQWHRRPVSGVRVPYPSLDAANTGKGQFDEAIGYMGMKAGDNRAVVRNLSATETQLLDAAAGVGASIIPDGFACLMAAGAPGVQIFVTKDKAGKIVEMRLKPLVTGQAV
jgi:hypothetical protein